MKRKLTVLLFCFFALSFGCAGKQKVDAPNAFNALREAYEPLPKVYDALCVPDQNGQCTGVITTKQYNDVIVPADKALYLGIQGGWIAVDTTGLQDLSDYKAKIVDGLDLLDTIQNEKLLTATAVIRVLVEAL
jgi:hypothetical protein